MLRRSIAVGFQPSRGNHPTAMIAASGLANDVEPGVIMIADRAITGAHHTAPLNDAPALVGAPRIAL